MNLTVAPSPIPSRDYRVGGVEGLPVQLENWNLAPHIFPNINAWLFAAFSPDGVTLSANGFFGGANLLTIEDVTVRLAKCEGDGIGDIRFLRLQARRKPGSTGAISAQTVRLKCSPQIAVVCTNATELFTAVNHGLVDDQIVQVGASVLPTGVTAATDYIVRDATKNTFKLTATLGGAAVNITTDGTGVYILPGLVEIGRIKVAAAAADADPVCDWLDLVFSAGNPVWTDQSTAPFTFVFEVSDTDLEVGLEVTGEN